MKYKRVIIKISGESLADKKSRAILDYENLHQIGQAIKSMVKLGAEVGIVIGAGNIWRGKLASLIGIEETTGDQMGMLGTIINSLALQSVLENIEVPCRVLSAVEVKAVSEPYIRRRAIRHLEKGRVVIFAGGTGNPYFTTDTSASLRALEIGAEAIFMGKNGIDGVYDCDPSVNPNAKFLKSLTYDEMLNRHLTVMDLTAVSLIREKDVILRVFDVSDPNNFLKALNGEDIGTIIKKGK